MDYVNIAMPKLKNGKTYIHKTITITKEHAEYVENNALNLSRFVQMKIDEAISKKKERK